MNSTKNKFSSPSTQSLKTVDSSSKKNSNFLEIEQARASRALLEVDLDAIVHNLQVLSQLAYGAKIMAVLKSNAYGLGACVLARLLQSFGVQAFAVDNIAEGIELRASGITEPILIIDGGLPDNTLLAVAHNLMPGIPHEDLLLAYDRAAEGLEDKYPIWLVANVGFNRSGYRNIERFTEFVLKARECQNLEVKAVYAHLTNSNGDINTNLAQIDDFKQIIKISRKLLGSDIETSLFASHGLVRWAKLLSTDWVRPGLLLYGEHAFDEDLIKPETKEVIRKLRPAIRLRAKIINLLNFSCSEAVGYGQKHMINPGQSLATVSTGFGSGYPFRSPKLHALVHGQKVPLFGEVGMDALQVNVTNVPDLKLYDWITLIGADGDERISVHSLALDAETTPYQLLSGLYFTHSYINSGSTVL